MYDDSNEQEEGTALAMFINLIQIVGAIAAIVFGLR